MEREDIKKLNRISLDFLKNSRFLTASCIVCVFFVSAMLIFDVSAYKKFKKVISSKYAGDIWRLRYNSRP